MEHLLEIYIKCYVINFVSDVFRLKTFIVTVSLFLHFYVGVVIGISEPIHRIMKIWTNIIVYRKLIYRLVSMNRHWLRFIWRRNLLAWSLELVACLQHLLNPMIDIFMLMTYLIFTWLFCDFELRHITVVKRFICVLARFWGLLIIIHTSLDIINTLSHIIITSKSPRFKLRNFKLRLNLSHP